MQREKALLVGVQLPDTRRQTLENSLAELRRLAETAGAAPADRIIQRRARIDSAYFIGRGKAEEIRDRIRSEHLRTVIFDEDLKPVQQKNLEEVIDAKIIDRTRLILDIFARRARSREGSLQVERAQLAYYLPRLTQKGVMLDSQVGGIGTRGPGEKKLEVDQRKIRDRIALLDRAIDVLRRQRDILRRRRRESGQPIVAIVGYTNAGKSTLLNALSHTGAVYADDKLFATLDPTTRQVRLPGGRVALFTDTVGFISKLPHMLIAAFRSTLEEAVQANCLLHVVDISQPDHEAQVQTVLGVLRELGAAHIPMVTVYNKADALSEAQRRRLERHGLLLVSARTGKGLPALLETIDAVVSPKVYPHRIVVPYDEQPALAALFRCAVVKRQRYTPRGIEADIESTPENWERIRALLKDPKQKLTV